MKRGNWFAGVLAGAFLALLLVWAIRDRESRANTQAPEIAEKCACAEPAPRDKSGSEGNAVASHLYYCKCGNLDCVVGKGSFSGVGGTGENFGLSCVKR